MSTITTFEKHIEFKKYLLSLISNCVVKLDNENYLDKNHYFDKNENFLMEYDKKTNIFWISYENIWSKLEKFGYTHNQIRDLAKPILESFFNYKVITTALMPIIGEEILKEHYKSIIVIKLLL